MEKFAINMTAAAKLSEAAEWALCSKYGITRTKHDSSAYDRNSDVNAGSVRISVKTSGFTLMAGNLCEGLEPVRRACPLQQIRICDRRG